jgi:LAO/AO transport system kinase
VGSIRALTGAGRLVSVPGQTWARLDRRILPDVLHLVRRYHVRITEGYGTVGHEPFGEHPLGLAVDIEPGAGGTWADVSRLARWAEPRQNHPRRPFRWVGWNGDFNHGHPSVCKPRLGCAPHLHLSWTHSAAPPGPHGVGLPGGRSRSVEFARMPARGRTAADLAERLLDGDKRALARAISLVENDDPEGWALVREVYPRTGRASIVGFTGPPGVGKSTLIGRLVELARGLERQVAVLSIDPSSPFTQGALLGDRIRLTDHFLDPGVYIRSMASRGSLGGLSEATLQAALLMDETVGVGQAEVDIIDHADTVVLVLMPGSGDSIQALKAGVMEIPDVIAVNKADHPLTDTMVREIRGVLSLGPQKGWRVPIVKTEAGRGEGVEELAEKIAAHHDFIASEGTLAERRRRNLMNEVVALAAGRMRRSLEAQVKDDPSVQELLDEVVSRRLDPASAAARLLEREEG